MGKYDERELRKRKERICTVIADHGQPIGLHRWVEIDGWVIDASNGGMGNPVLFQRAEDYYSHREMTDIKEAVATAMAA
jgi:hypothetical protein